MTTFFQDLRMNYLYEFENFFVPVYETFYEKDNEI